MNRLMVFFIVIFVGVSGGAFLMMQDTHPVPLPASLSKATDNADALAKTDETPASAPTSATDPDRDKPQAKPAGDPLPKIKEANNDPLPESPKPKERSARKNSKSTTKSKPVVINRPAFNPKPREVNGGIWDEDLDRLQGTWRIVDTEYDGNRLTEEAQKYSWEFKVDQYTIKCQGNFQELWHVQVDSSRRLKTIDSTHDLLGKTFKGIYEVTDDTLKVCYDLTGNGRPDSFKAAQGSRRVCYYFRR